MAPWAGSQMRQRWVLSNQAMGEGDEVEVWLPGVLGPGVKSLLS